MNSERQIMHLVNNPDLVAQYEVISDVPYSEKAGAEAKLSLILPWSLGSPNLKTEKAPLLVFVQGSAWTTPNVYFQLPQLTDFVRAGFRVATVVHRSIMNGHPFPAFLEDVKTAIRFLRANADKYAIDPEHVAIWGTSSGGNTALLVGVTGDDPQYQNGEYAEYSDSVQAVVECFGPTDLKNIFVGTEQVANGGENPGSEEGLAFVTAAFGPDRSTWIDKLAEFSPCMRLAAGKAYPPFLLLHGTADPVVPYQQMLTMLDALDAVGAEADAYAVDGAEHEGTFWTPEVYDIIREFLEDTIGAEE